MPIRIIANRPDTGLPEEYARKLRDAQESHHLPPDARVLFVEVQPSDASQFSEVLVGRRARTSADTACCGARARPFRTPSRRCCCSSATRRGNIPHAYFGWTEGNPIVYLLKFLAFGEGDTAPVTREVLRQAEPDPELRPRIHVG